MALTREQLLRQFELAADRFSGLQYVLLAWPCGSQWISPFGDDIPPKYRQLPCVSKAAPPPPSGTAIEFTVWPEDCSGHGGAIEIDGYKTCGHLRMNYGVRQWFPDRDEPENLDFELEARRRYQWLADQAVAIVEDPRGLRWSELLHDRLRPVRQPIRDGWYAVIPDVFLASLEVLNAKPNGKARNDEPTAAEIQRAEEVIAAMGVSDPTRDGFKAAAQKAGLKIGSAKAGKIIAQRRKGRKMNPSPPSPRDG